MNAISLPKSSIQSDWQPLKKIGPLGAIVLAHIGLLYVLQSGLPKHSVERTAAPREVIATFIQPEPAPKPKPEVPQPTPPKPKTVPVVKKAVKTPPKPLSPTPTPIPAQPLAETTPIQAPVSSAPPAPAAPAAAPAATTPAPPKVISGVAYIRKVEPEYPLQSRRLGEEGLVVLRVHINEKGHPERVEIQQSSGFVRLDEAAKKAALSSLFKPYMEDGKPMPFITPAPFRFEYRR